MTVAGQATSFPSMLYQQDGRWLRQLNSQPGAGPKSGRSPGPSESKWMKLAEQCSALRSGAGQGQSSHREGLRLKVKGKRSGWAGRSPAVASPFQGFG